MLSIWIPTEIAFSCKEVIAAALLCILLARLVSRARQCHHHQLPPGPKGYPLVGALPLLGDMPHVALARMAKAYGPVMYLKVGTWGMVVASTPDSAKAFLKTLDANFSNRPPNAGATLLAYGAQDMVFAPYGPKWRLLRKISNLHMLGGKALEGWADIRSTEVGHMLHAMHLACGQGKAISLQNMLIYSTANMIGQVIFSQRIFGSHSGEGKEAINEFKDMVVELMTTAGYFNIGDFMPCLAWMDLQGIEKGMKLLHKKFDHLITRMMDDHLASASQRSDKPDFLDIVMALNRNNDHSLGEQHLTTTNIKALLLNLLTAGTDTSSSVIEWALAEMMQNPAIQKRAQEEMDLVVGRNRRLTESDLPKLTYLKAICKEAYRKHPSTPLNLPRISSEACVVNGYHIPKNTRLSVNIWAIGRDPDVWENPLDFNPERFMSGKNNANKDPGGNDFDLIPFGAGRRICAGARMGTIIVEYVLGTLVQAFEWRMPDGEKEMNMEEAFGLALRKAVPLTAMLTPRLPPHIYLPFESIQN